MQIEEGTVRESVDGGSRIILYYVLYTEGRSHARSGRRGKTILLIYLYIYILREGAMLELEGGRR